MLLHYQNAFSSILPVEVLQSQFSLRAFLCKTLFGNNFVGWRSCIGNLMCRKYKKIGISSDFSQFWKFPPTDSTGCISSICVFPSTVFWRRFLVDYKIELVRGIGKLSFWIYKNSKYCCLLSMKIALQLKYMVYISQFLVYSWSIFSANVDGNNCNGAAPFVTILSLKFP